MIERTVQMGSKLYVGNLSFDVTEEDLRKTFSADGRGVTEIAVVTDRDTGRPRGFAFVTMASNADAQAAISALDGVAMLGRNLKVSEAQERPARNGGGNRARRF
jgi:RNA recognition motif-containing protein